MLHSRSQYNNRLSTATQEVCMSTTPPHCRRHVRRRSISCTKSSVLAKAMPEGLLASPNAGGYSDRLRSTFDEYS